MGQCAIPQAIALFAAIRRVARPACIPGWRYRFSVGREADAMARFLHVFFVVYIDVSVLALTVSIA